MQSLFKQLTIERSLVILTAILVLLILIEMNYFTSGVLGAITLYVVCRNFYFHLVEKKRWNKILAITLIIFLIIVCFGVPIWLILEILIPQINGLIQNPEAIVQRFQPVIDYIQTHEWVRNLDIKISNEQIFSIINKALSYIPSTLSWVGQLLANVLVALFILYFMLLGGRKMENKLWSFMPFSEVSKAFFVRQNLELIRSNAYGIPILAVSQGVIAIIGYMIFGIEQGVFWGLLTGIASVLPVVGTMVVWIPICIYQIATGQVQEGLMLSLYCFVLVGGIDNVLRFTILKRMADIHPLITVFGVLLGLQLFGVMGLVFGPLLLSLPIIFYQVYEIERHGNKPVGVGDTANPEESNLIGTKELQK